MASLPFTPRLQPLDPLQNWRRAVTALAVATVIDRDVRQAADRLYGKELGAEVAKAAVAPAATNVGAWAGALVGTIIEPFLKSLRPKSAAAQLMDLGTMFDLRRGALSLPKLASDFPNAAWVAEAAPAPVLQGTFASTPVAARKLVALSALTNDFADRIAEDAERIVSDLLTDSAGRALDAKMFSTDAATAVAPAGLLNGIAPTAGTAGGGQGAMASDLRALTAAVAAAGAGGNLVVIASPAQAMSLQVLAGSAFATPIIIAPSLAAGTVIVLDAAAFASGFGAEPQIDVAGAAVVHLEDATPLNIGTAGAPNTVAAPVRSAFQADLKVLRCILRVGFALRAPAIAFTTSATW